MEKEKKMKNWRECLISEKGRKEFLLKSSTPPEGRLRYFSFFYEEKWNQDEILEPANSEVWLGGSEKWDDFVTA